jgi:hypothetical protein
MEAVEGGCLCGAVRFTAQGKPFRVGTCHCLDCRKHHGAPFFAAAIFLDSAVTITGETHSYRDRHFCPICGSSPFSRWQDEIAVHNGALDEPSRFRPTYELWTIRRESWLAPVQGAKQFPKDRGNGRTEE